MNNVTARLEKGKKKLLAGLPDCGEIIRGTLMKYHLTCGNNNCHCHSKGSKKHGPYWYIAVSYGKNKRQKLYKLQRAAVGEAKKKINNYRQLWKVLCALSEKNIQLLRAGKNEIGRKMAKAEVAGKGKARSGKNK